MNPSGAGPAGSVLNGGGGHNLEVKWLIYGTECPAMFANGIVQTTEKTLL